MKRKVRPRSRRQRWHSPKPPPLRFTAYAWAKLLHLRDLGRTEVGGFGVSNSQELLLIEDVQLVRQSCTAMTVKFDDHAIADYFDAQVDEGRTPEQFARIWIHTHPGDSPRPSSTDEETFERCFENTAWALMFILARGGNTYARLRFGTGPGGELMLPVQTDFRVPFAAANQAGWTTEYKNFVSLEPERHCASPLVSRSYPHLPWSDRDHPSPDDQWSDISSTNFPSEPIHAPF